MTKKEISKDLNFYKIKQAEFEEKLRGWEKIRQGTFTEDQRQTILSMCNKDTSAKIHYLRGCLIFFLRDLKDYRLKLGKPLKAT
jgi:hypothetical protein